MTKNFTVMIGVLALTVSALCLRAQDINVTGDWDMKTQTPRGERNSVVNFVQEGEKLTVRTTGMRGDEITGTGSIKGADIEWSFTRTRPDGGQFTTAYKGKVDGGTMSGTVDFGPMGSLEWTAKKKAS